MKHVKWSERKKGMLLGFLITTLLTACAGGVMIGVGCDVYSTYRVDMPSPVGATRAFLEWLNLLDTEMFSVCKRG